MDYNFVTQPFTARHVRFTKKLGFGSLGTRGSIGYEKNKDGVYLCDWGGGGGG